MAIDPERSALETVADVMGDIERAAKVLPASDRQRFAAAAVHAVLGWAAGACAAAGLTRSQFVALCRREWRELNTIMPKGGDA